MSDLASRIAYVRGIAGLSQREMGTLAGLDKAHVRLLETGARGAPALETISKIATAYDVSLEWLTYGTGRRPATATVRAAVDRARGRRTEA